MEEPEKRARGLKESQNRIQLDLTKEYGLVLEGGGAKGAFQIGVWKALREAGIKIKGIAGVSVGALNGALICMDDLETAEKIWKEIRYGTIMNVNEELIEKISELGSMWSDLKLNDLKHLGIFGTVQEVREEIKHILKDRGFDITPLKELIHEAIDEEKMRQSDCELFVSTFSLTDRKLLHIDMKTMPEGEIEDILLASAYLPVFKTEKLGGKMYTDGGGFNNVPLDVLVNKGYEDIIVIRIYGLGLDRERKVKIPDGTTIYHIAPREELGGMLRFEKKQSRKNMTLGYLEGKRFLYGLEGRRYFIDAPYQESYYFNKMVSEIDGLKEYLDQKIVLEGKRNLEGYRFYTEELFPEMAKELNLKKEWDYKELYLAILDHLARKMRVFRYKIYTEDELLSEVHRAIDKREQKLLACLAKKENG